MANQETAFGLRPIGLVGSGANSTPVASVARRESLLRDLKLIVPKEMRSRIALLGGDARNKTKSSSRAHVHLDLP